MNIFDSAANRLLIVAHRGSSAGNVPCNTMAAYKAALAQGADMIEVDANMSKDGTLYSFHHLPAVPLPRGGRLNGSSRRRPLPKIVPSSADGTATAIP